MVIMTHKDFVFTGTFTEQYGIQHYAILLKIKTHPPSLIMRNIVMITQVGR